VTGRWLEAVDLQDSPPAVEGCDFHAKGVSYFRHVLAVAQLQSAEGPEHVHLDVESADADDLGVEQIIALRRLRYVEPWVLIRHS
jgi:hypothetical protein